MDKSTNGRSTECLRNSIPSSKSSERRRRNSKSDQKETKKYDDRNNSNFDNDRCENVDNYKSNSNSQRGDNERKNPFRNNRLRYSKPPSKTTSSYRMLDEMQPPPPPPPSSQQSAPIPLSAQSSYNTKMAKDGNSFDKDFMNNRRKYDDRYGLNLPPNIESMPPRFQKQFFMKHGIDPGILTKSYDYKDPSHQNQHRIQKDRLKNHSSRDSPDRYRQPNVWQTNVDDYDHVSQQSDKDMNYSYGDMRKSDKNVPYKVDKLSGVNSLRGRQNDMAHFSSGRSITYDRSSADRVLRVTKKVDWPDDITKDSYNRRPSMNSRNDDNSSGYYFESEKEMYRHTDSGSNQNHRYRDVDRESRSAKYERNTRENYIISVDSKAKCDDDIRNSIKPGVLHVSPNDQDGAKSIEQRLMEELHMKNIKFDNYYIRPNWYGHSESYTKPQTKLLVKRLEKADAVLQSSIVNGDIFQNWKLIMVQRKSIQELYEQFLTHEMKLCREENVEQHFWKILFYNFFEIFKSAKKELSNDDGQTYCNEKAIELVENGLLYFENMLRILETVYKFKVSDYIGINAGASIKGLKFVSLAIISAQKICLFLGDLYRYREQFLNSKNFGKAKQWYIKAQQLVPANGIPYNQLAILSLCTKRKFDAVYYHARSLTSSNPIQSAKESLKVLFDEIRKKYESSQSKQQKETKNKEPKRRNSNDPLRRETWIHPEGGPKMYRMAFIRSQPENGASSDDDDYSNMDSIELSKRFTTSYLHVHGKLITKIGMDSFMQCATQMLKEFRILLRHSPIVLTTDRLIQLMALNMFAIENASSSGSTEKGRTEIQDFALSLSFSMIGIILERFFIILNNNSIKTNENIDNNKEKSAKKLEYLNPNVTIEINRLSEDAKVILPAIKICCDWLMLHMNLWKSPPACIDDTMSRNLWLGIEQLGTLLERTKIEENIYTNYQKNEDCLVRLPEEISLLGFTTFRSSSGDRFYCSPDEDVDFVQNLIRLKSILSSIQIIKNQCNLASLQKDQLNSTNLLIKGNDSDLLLESFSDNDDFDESSNKIPEKQTAITSVLPSTTNNNDEKSAEIRKLLRRKDELERRHKMQEKHNQRLQEILNQRPILLNIEVRPKYLVPDTNCYIDFLKQIKLISNVYPLYYIVVPLAVTNELEGLSRGTRPNSQIDQSPIAHSSSSTIKDIPSNEQHNARVASSAQLALTFLKTKDPVIKFCTTNGSFLNSSVFTMENDKCDKISNDDKILLTASNLCKHHADEQRGEFQYIVRDVVLLTTDRNLRVKALSQNVPVREVPDFIKWSGLGD